MIANSMKQQPKKTEGSSGQRGSGKGSIQLRGMTYDQQVAALSPVQCKRSDVVQMQQISADAAEEAMQQVGGEFANGDYEILTPYGNNPEATNCHGYTIHQAVDNWAYPDGLLAEIGDDDNVAVFVNGNAIGHSGRYAGGTLTHFLIGVGIVRSTIGLNDTAGYDARYNLPGDRAALDDFLAGVAEAEQRQERRDLVMRILDHANQVGVQVAQGATIGDWDDLDGNDAQDEFIEQNLEEINRVRLLVNTEEHGGDYEEVA